MKPSIVSIGAGNVASNLIPALAKKKYSIAQVWSRKIKHAKTLASKVGATATSSQKRIIKDADIYIISIPDDIILTVSDCLPFTPNDTQVLLHTSGSTPSFDNKKIHNNGVLYPLQSFNKEKEISFKDIPVFINASNKKTLKVIERMAQRISKNVVELSDIKRKQLHLSAVILNNFIHHLAYKSEAQLDKYELEFTHLQPLLNNTFKKILSGDLLESQTGPAKRNDQGVIKGHLKLLSKDKELQDIYKTISKSIIKTYS